MWYRLKSLMNERSHLGSGRHWHPTMLVVLKHMLKMHGDIIICTKIL